jgi:3-oxoacyl-[acyl-carrier protein] reductase
MDLGLKGLKAVVTGGTKGIGHAIAQTLATEGAHVAFCARNADEVAQTVRDFAGYGVKISGRAVDVADGTALAAWVSDVAAEFGGIDIVVANVSGSAVSRST